MEPIFVYITLPDMEHANELGLAIVEDRFAACVNIIPQMKSIYRWGDKVEKTEEVIMIAKTTRDQFADLAKFVQDNHPYEVPCIVALPVVFGEANFLKWVAENSLPKKK